MNRYVLLKDELDSYIDSYDANPGITPNQRARWRREGKTRAITHPMLGTNGKTNPDCLRLLTEDGHDGYPVGSISPGQAERIWDYNTSHAFPPARDLVRFSVFMHLDCYRTLALVLKGEWERYFGYTLKGWRTNNARNLFLIDILKGTTEQEMRQANSKFSPNTQDIFDLLELHGKIASGAGYTGSNFESLVREMIHGEYHWVGQDNKTLAHFIATETERMHRLREGNAEEQQAFWLARCSWTQLQADLDDLHVRIENTRLANREAERQWLAVFGDLELELEKLEAKIWSLERRILIKQNDPALGLEAVDNLLAADEKMRQKLLEDLRFMVGIAPFLQKADLCGTAAGPEQKNDYQRECKQLIRQIYTLIHPDHLENHPKYHDLTDRQREELKTILLACLEIRPEELGVPKGFIEHDMRTPDGLRRVLERVELILEKAGIDIKIDAEIQGETIQEQLVWLEEACQKLEKDHQAGRSTLKAMMENADIRQKLALLDLPEQHDKVREDIRKKIDDNKTKVEALTREVQALFEETNQ